MLSLLISLGALALSVVTAYLTLFRRGTVRMTKPMTVYFGPDGGIERRLIRADKPLRPKVYLRSIIYSTGKRGHIIESMFLTLRRAETRQTFSVWVYGEDNLRRGSGLFVGEEGVTFNHHFLLPTDGSTFSFLAGDYQADIFATVVGRPKRLHLLSVKLLLSAALADELSKPLNSGVYFDWGPESGGYQAHSRANN